MSKDFEKEYRDLAALEIPDLWDRIEAALPEKTKTEASDNVIQFKEETQRTTSKRKKNIWPYVIPAVSAAALIVVVAIPAVLLMSGAIGNHKTETAAGFAGAQSYDEAPQQDVCYEEEACYEIGDETYSNELQIKGAGATEATVKSGPDIAPSFDDEVVNIPPVDGYDMNNRFEAYLENIIAQDDEVSAYVNYGVTTDIASSARDVLKSTEDGVTYVIDVNGFVPSETGVYGGLYRVIDDNLIELYIYENYFE